MRLPSELCYRILVREMFFSYLTNKLRHRKLMSSRFGKQQQLQLLPEAHTVFLGVSTRVQGAQNDPVPGDTERPGESSPESLDLLVSGIEGKDSPYQQHILCGGLQLLRA